MNKILNLKISTFLILGLSSASFAEDYVKCHVLLNSGSGEDRKIAFSDGFGEGKFYNGKVLVTVATDPDGLINHFWIKDVKSGVISQTYLNSNLLTLSLNVGSNTIHGDCKF